MAKPVRDPLAEKNCNHANTAIVNTKTATTTQNHTGYSGFFLVHREDQSLSCSIQRLAL
jgi:hypothetical protein